MSKARDFGIIFWLHSIAIILIYTSPFIIPWFVILLFVFLYYIQLFLLGNCLLTLKQFKQDVREETFYSYYLGKLGFEVNKKRLVFALDYIIPWLILAVALFWQVNLRGSILLY